MLIGERRLVALAEIEECWIGEDEGILKAASTWTAILLGDLIGEPSSAVGLLLGRLVEQLGWAHVGLVPAFDTGIAGECALGHTNRHALVLGPGRNGIDIGDDQRAQLEERQQAEEAMGVGAADLHDSEVLTA